MSEVFYGRAADLEGLKSFVDERSSGFTYLRGRRRIGKSWLLKRFQSEVSNVFYFSGRKDESLGSSLSRFAKEWDSFTTEVELSKYSMSHLSWDELLKPISARAKNRKIH